MIETVRQWNTQCSLIIQYYGQSVIVIVNVNVPQVDNHTLWSATLWVTRLMLTQLSPLVGITQLYIHCNSLYILVDRFFQRQYCHYLQDSSVVHLLQLTIYPSWSIFWRQYCQHIQGHTVLYLLQLTIYPSWSAFFGDNIVIVIVKSFKVCRPHPWDPNYSPWEQIVSTVPYAVLREYPQIITRTQIQVRE